MPLGPLPTPMSEHVYDGDFSSMGSYSGPEWIPSSTSSLENISYQMDEAFLGPQLSYVNTPSIAAPVDQSRPRSSTTSYPTPHPGYARPRSVSASGNVGGGNLYSSNNVGDFVLDSNANALGVRHASLDDTNYSNSSQHHSHSTNTYFSSSYMPMPDAGRLGSISMPRAPVAIAPNPAGLQKMGSLKRGREDDMPSPETTMKRRRRSSVATAHGEQLTDDERLLLHLKDELNLPWKDIALRFQVELGKSHQVPALQMRYKRLRERLRVWTEVDVQALQQARDYWEKFKWDIIATKMLDFGCSEKWPGKYCIRKWEEMHPELDMSKEQQGGSVRGEDSERSTPYPPTPRP